MPFRPFSAAAGALAAWGAAAAIAAAEPSAPPLSALEPEIPTLRAAYAERLSAEGAAYDARTDLRDEGGGPRFLNRLIREASPYLRQHAHNPIDWRPWGPEALAAAQAANKPIFLSVGYATCHWCHVMAEESFDTLEAAEALNRDFIAIKVDREVSPDVDETYMTATLISQGVGGWPNSVWLTPEGAPFLAATYLPKADFLNALRIVSTHWTENEPRLRAAGAQLSDAVRAAARRSAAAAEIGAEAFAATAEAIARDHNILEGGFSQDQQFPMEVYLRFLLDRWRRDGEPSALTIAARSLDAMIAGGIHDHVGGGFHRYAVDPLWSLPHFEKMLYTQAQIAGVLIEAWEATGRARYARAARRTLDYALRDLRAEDGAFFAAEDAVSRPPGAEPGAPREEGAFYAWSAEQAEAALGPDAAAAIAALGIEGHARIAGGAVPQVDITEIDALPALDASLAALRRAREARPRPLRDEKVIAGWNGLMIAALADAGAGLDAPAYVAAAAKAGEAVWRRLWRDGALNRFYAPGETDTAAAASLHDHAWLGLGYLALWDATGDPDWRERAQQLAAAIETRFSDGAGRLKMMAEDGPLGPVYESDDLSTPTGESSALELFARLAWRETGLENRGRAEALLAALSGDLAARPRSRPVAMLAAATLIEGDSAARRPFARGKGRVALRREGTALTATLTLAPGWHVNADQPLEDNLIATELSGGALASVAYPPAKTVALGFNDAPLAVWEGVVALRADVAPDAATGPIEVALTAQACNDEICLAPETLRFRLGPPAR